MCDFIALQNFSPDDIGPWTHIRDSAWIVAVDPFRISNYDPLIYRRRKIKDPLPDAYAAVKTFGSLRELLIYSPKHWGKVEKAATMVREYLRDVWTEGEEERRAQVEGSWIGVKDEVPEGWSMLLVTGLTYEPLDHHHGAELEMTGNVLSMKNAVLAHLSE
jgi:hypothetical protein